MRLLDLSHCDLGAGYLQLTDTGGKAPPPYAILSHRWEAGEILYSDIGSDHAKDKNGWTKLAGAIEQARKDNYRYLWIDTCCIDKTSSAELSEAINSMYRWYGDARVCYVYLSDVSFDSVIMPRGIHTRRQSATARRYYKSALRDSAWFTRGWTLQELISPHDVNFFTKEWALIGNKASLKTPISRVTGISPAILTGDEPVASASIARRMSWASQRETSRIEDIAYCLLGIFSVNIPLLYGEGERAFIRLQEEILKGSDDHSIFAWKDSEAPPQDSAEHGLLADHPAAFRDSGDIVPYRWDTEPFAMTNKGLQISLEVSQERQELATLPCAPSTSHHSLLAIRIAKIAGGFRQYVRSDIKQLITVTQRGQARLMFFPQNYTKVKGASTLYHQFTLCMNRASESDLLRYYFLAHAERPSTIRDSELKLKGDSVVVHRSTFETRTERFSFPKRSHGAWLRFLVRRPCGHAYAGNIYFVIFVGADKDGEIGFCVQPFAYRDAKVEGLVPTSPPQIRLKSTHNRYMPAAMDYTHPEYLAWNLLPIGTTWKTKQLDIVSSTHNGQPSRVIGSQTLDITIRAVQTDTTLLKDLAQQTSEGRPDNESQDKVKDNLGDSSVAHSNEASQDGSGKNLEDGSEDDSEGDSQEDLEGDTDDDFESIDGLKHLEILISNSNS